MANTDRLLTLDELAERLRRSRSQIHWMRQRGTGPKTAVIGGRVMARESDVDAWIDAQFEKEAS